MMTQADQPQQIGKFPVVRRLGSGAMGEVFLCVQPELDRHVALKVMRGGAGQWPRFQRESRSAARLVHPYVVRVYDVGIDHDSPYIVMEYVDGRPLSELIGTEYLSLSVTLRLLYHMTEALAAAHSQSIIHRDLKPSNILIDSQGRPRLTDFGLAKSLLHDPTLSGSGELIGTPRYMAPEQILGGNSELDQRVDLFALGVVMYEMLSGRPPFDGSSVVQILRQVTDDDPAELKSINPAIPECIAAIVRKALSKLPEDRYQTAAEMGAALRDVLLSETFTAADGGLRANEYLSAFVPAPTEDRSTWILNTPSRRRLAWVATCVMLLSSMLGGWWLVSRWDSNAGQELDDNEYEGAKWALLQEVDQVRRGTLRIPEQKTPRDALKEDLEEATSLLRRNPTDDDVRLARARLLRRAGECLAADAECSLVLQHQPDLLAARVDRLLARSQLWGLYLGGWNDRILRFPINPLLKDDLAVLESSEDEVLVHIAKLCRRLGDDVRLGDDDSEDLLTLVKSAPSVSHDLVSSADIAALHAELLFREAETAETSPGEGDSRPSFGTLAAAAKRQLRIGLETDPCHVPLLYLRASSFSRRVGWDDIHGGEDRSAAMKRSLFQFEAAMDQLLRVTLRQGCDTPIARAVILTNMDWSLSASEQQLQDALSCRPTVPQLQSVRTWLRLKSPEDGTHTPESLNRLLREFLERSVDDSEEQTADFVKAVLYAGLERYPEARRALRVCRRKYKQTEGWLSLDSDHQQWIDSSEASETAMLYATRPIVAQLPIAPDVGFRLHEALWSRLENTDALVAEGHSEAEIREFRAWTQFSHAEIHAARVEREQVLEHIRLALEQKLPDIHGEMCRNHWAFAEWKDDAAFDELYRTFPEPVPATDPETESPNESPAEPLAEPTTALDGAVTP